MILNSSKLFLFVLPLFLFSCKCNDEEEMNGGPCSYETKFYPATIIAIENIDSTNADIIFRVEDTRGQVYRDSISWYQEKKNWIPIADMKKDSLAIGQKLKYQIDELKTGSCNPHIERLLLEKYQHF